MQTDQTKPPIVVGEASAADWQAEIDMMSQGLYLCRCGALVRDFDLAEAEAEGFDPDTCDVLCEACKNE